MKTTYVCDCLVAVASVFIVSEVTYVGVVMRRRQASRTARISYLLLLRISLACSFLSSCSSFFLLRITPFPWRVYFTRHLFCAFLPSCTQEAADQNLAHATGSPTLEFFVFLSLSTVAPSAGSFIRFPLNCR